MASLKEMSDEELKRIYKQKLMEESKEHSMQMGLKIL